MQLAPKWSVEKNDAEWIYNIHPDPTNLELPTNKTA